MVEVVDHPGGDALEQAAPADEAAVILLLPLRKHRAELALNLLNPFALPRVNSDFTTLVSRHRFGLLVGRQLSKQITLLLASDQLPPGRLVLSLAVAETADRENRGDGRSAAAQAVATGYETCRYRFTLR